MNQNLPSWSSNARQYAFNSRSVSLFIRWPIKKAESNVSLTPDEHLLSSNLKGRTSLRTPWTSSYPRWPPAKTSLRAPTNLISLVPFPTYWGPIELPTPIIEPSGSAMKITSDGSARTRWGQKLLTACFSPSLHWVASGKAFARIVIAAKNAPSCAFETCSSSFNSPLANKN